jgi:hypothetical protein
MVGTILILLSNISKIKEHEKVYRLELRFVNEEQAWMSDISLPFQSNWGHIYAWYGLIDNRMCTFRFLFIAQVWPTSAHVRATHFLSTETSISRAE